MATYPIFLADGRGTSLWPLSRGDKPKQFLSLNGKQSLFQQAVLRHRNIAELPDLTEPIVVCKEADRFQINDALDAIGERASAVLEPLARNTAPAIAAVAALVATDDPDAILLIVPSDNFIHVDDTYGPTLAQGVEAARAGRMVTFGVVPTYPETGYGYIKASPGEGIRTVEQFVEKPVHEPAEAIVADGRHYWNTGFFAFAAGALLDELAHATPEVTKAAEAAVKTGSRIGEEGALTGSLTLDAVGFCDAPDISTGCALLERTDKVTVAPLNCRWSDVGSWRTYWETLDKDNEGNAVVGRGTIIDTQGSLVVSENVDVVALGLTDTAVITTPDAVLVCPLSRTQDIKQVVAVLREGGRTNLLDKSPTVNRPWGGYTSIMNGERFQVKHLFVDPGKQLSLQKHHHRSEHWVVVRGTAEVTVDDKMVMLSENQSTYIPLGAVHRLANPGRIRLEVIEVQTGSYLGEDDIVRLEDAWGRS